MSRRRLPSFRLAVMLGVAAAATPHGAGGAGTEPARMTRELTLTHPYLHLPVKTGAPMRRVRLVVDGQTAREFDVELSGNAPDFRTFLDVGVWEGRTVALEADGPPASPSPLQNIRQGDTVPDAGDMYRERDRPLFHFTSRRGWLNDPNGLVYDRGAYHLYYQHNPYGWAWGNMHWGHAVSADLVHWKEQPIALYPHAYGDWAYSGSAVVDRDNTAGFRTGRRPPIVIAYTSTGRGECIAYSNDDGRTFTEYAGNPVIRHKGRDPRLFWYAPARHWVMAVYDEGDGDARDIAFYTSSDLKAWRYTSRVSGYFECPDLFELPVDGNPGHTKWLLHAADGAYALGRFDGETFTPETETLPGAFGGAFYAAQSYNGIPEKDGRRLRVGWAKVEFPGMPFNQMMNFPVELSLRTTPDGVRLFTWPAREIERLYGKRHRVQAGVVRPGENPLAGVSGDALDIRADLEPRGDTPFTLAIHGVPITWDPAKGTLTCQGRSAPVPLTDGRARLRVLVDRGLLEIFGGDGRVYMPVAVSPHPSERGLSLTVSSGPLEIHDLDVREVRSAWTDGRRVP